MHYWGEAGVGDWQSLRAPAGEKIIGVVMAFAEPNGFEPETSRYSHYKTSSAANLAIPLETMEESNPRNKSCRCEHMNYSVLRYYSRLGAELEVALCFYLTFQRVVHASCGK